MLIFVSPFSIIFSPDSPILVRADTNCSAGGIVSGNNGCVGNGAVPPNARVAAGSYRFNLLRPILIADAPRWKPIASLNSGSGAPGMIDVILDDSTGLFTVSVDRVVVSTFNQLGIATDRAFSFQVVTAFPV